MGSSQFYLPPTMIASSVLMFNNELLSRATGSISSGNFSAFNILAAKHMKLQAMILLPFKTTKVAYGNTNF